MKKFLLKEELLAVLRNRKLLIPIIAVMFIPILYSGMFLWAFWDPYDHLKDLPVAIVNEDDGASYEGRELRLGQDLVEKLKESNQFDFSFVKDKEQALEDLKNEKYYLLVEIPKDFSENATTLLDENPKKLQLTYVPNEGYNFLAAQIGGTAVEKIKAALSSKVTETYAESMFDKVGELADGMAEASDGASQLHDGTVELNNGSATLNEKLALFEDGIKKFSTGMSEAATGSVKLGTGAEKLSSGLEQLQAGHNQLTAASTKLNQGASKVRSGVETVHQGLVTVDEKLPQLIAGTAQLQTGADSLSGGLSALKTGAEQVNGGVVALKQSLQAVLGTLPADSPQRVALETALAQLDAGTKSLASNAGLLANGATSLSQGLQTVSDGQQELSQGIGKLSAGADELETGAKDLAAGQSQFVSGMTTFSGKLSEASQGAQGLASGASDLTTGLSTLQSATTTISSGSEQLYEGSGKIVDGASKLADGSNELATKLGEGADRANSVEVTNKTVDMLATPVEIKEQKVNKVSNYGTGFAPYFLSLGLFVGALLLSIVFPLREPAMVPKNGVSWFTSKFAILSGIGVIQGVIAATILLLTLGLEVQNTFLFYLFAVVTSITFIALVQLLVTTLGDPGRFVAIIILILQLTTSAGTFPLELIPNALQPISSFLPMTYTVQGFKAVISSGDMQVLWSMTGILAIYIVVSCIGTLLYFISKHKRQFNVMMQE